ncbi:hypothetical protein D6851_02505 [Altericroceibacterium spongiae]|uniref:Uncharacterized protein n=1 Tax=Altericroceibacterium spongiae TaxID=2320269 RepID=A0A420ERQ4_9SPHN|nr:hypothetical protein [Altericroceibacterium spongiae]RKF23362.1 hypothetical protein D6851_02505 [Altericroceibacterium spongiae]
MSYGTYRLRRCVVTPVQMQRLQEVHAALKNGEGLEELASRTGVKPNTIRTSLVNILGSSAWPPPIEAVEEALKLPACNPYEKTANRFDGVAVDFDAEERELEQRRFAVEEARLERERRLLAEEQRKYGLKKPGKPISEMPI